MARLQLLAWVEPVVWIEGGLYSSLNGQVHRVNFVFEELAFQRADAVLARQRAAEVQR